MTRTDWPNVVVIGAGAVGSYFGAMLARAGAPVAFVGRPGSTNPHVAEVHRCGIEIDGVEIQEVHDVRVETADAALESAELVLFAVKSMDTETAGTHIRDHLEDDALVVSLQNGIDNVETLAGVGIEALPTVVYVAAAIERPGAVRHRGRGDLVIGDPTGEPERRAAAERVATWFEAAEVPCPVSDDIRHAQWMKLTLNSMTNATSALTAASYRRVAEFEPTWELALAVAREAIDVAAAEGTRLDLDEIVELAQSIVDRIGEATSSTQQDIAAGRRTEVEALNGAIARRGAQLGIATPTNDALRALLKLRERIPG